MDWTIVAGRPVYLQLIEQLELAIITGEYPRRSGAGQPEYHAARAGRIGSARPAGNPADGGANRHIRHGKTGAGTAVAGPEAGS
mgnify:CR=1 FL=1